MRVMLVCHRFPPEGVAGVERITQFLARELTRTGHSVSIIAGSSKVASAHDRPAYTLRERLPDGTRLYRFVGARFGLDRFLIDSHKLEQLFTAALIEEAPDVVHVLHLMGLSPRFLEIARRQQVAVVVSLQDFYFACPLILLRKPSGELCAGPDGGRECARTCFSAQGGGSALKWGLRATYFRRLLDVADRIICPTHFVARYFQQFGARADRIRVIANGVSIPRLAAESVPFSPVPRSALNIAFLGSVVRHKGVHVVLQALQIARLDRVNLLVAGDLADQEYVAELRRQAAAIPDLALRIHGSYEPAQVPALLHDADCLIAPSQWPETFAIVTREALMCGVPIIVSRQGGLPEAVIEGHNGFVFDPFRPTELASILRRLVQEPDLLNRLRNAARTTSVMSTAEHGVAVEAIYEEALHERRRYSDSCRGDADELRFLHGALLDLGCGAAG